MTLYDRIAAAIEKRLAAAQAAETHPDPRVRAIAAGVERRDGCWVWSQTTLGGYAKRDVDGRTVALHRWMYEACIGPVSDGLELDHTCRVRNCVNPAHLEPVTSSENKRRAHAARGVYDACPNGHPRQGPPPGGRVAACLTCKREERRRRVSRGPRPDSPHGTVNTYNLGCRCDACRKARHDYDAAAKARRYEIGVDDGDG
jgi:hypothetical protein